MSEPTGRYSGKSFEREIFEDLSEVKTDIQVIKKDVDNLRYMYQRVETSLAKLDTATNKLENIMGQQEKTLSSMEKMLTTRSEMMDRDVTRINREFDAEIEDIRFDGDTKGKLIEERLKKLEFTRWLLIGAIAIITFFAPYIDRHFFPTAITIPGITH